MERLRRYDAGEVDWVSFSNEDVRALLTHLETAEARVERLETLLSKVDYYELWEESVTLRSHPRHNLRRLLTVLALSETEAPPQERGGGE